MQEIQNKINRQVVVSLRQRQAKRLASTMIHQLKISNEVSLCYMLYQPKSTDNVEVITNWILSNNDFTTIDSDLAEVIKDKLVSELSNYFS